MEPDGTLGVGSTLGRCYEGHRASRTPAPGGSLDKRGQTGSWCYGSLESEGNLVEAGGVQDNGRSRTAWGTRLPPTDRVWRREMLKMTRLRRMLIKYLHLKAKTYFMPIDFSHSLKDKYRKL